MTCNTPKSTSVPHWRRRSSRSNKTLRDAIALLQSKGATDIRHRRDKRLTAALMSPWWGGVNAK
ncbi:hypothetical protein [Bradyrhizobium sp. 30]|uniref:hypothetical protein n=1 Tax=Bradyrhizobium sp. 30 TaxID=2782669 RepID=UPI001FF9A669|nr:hypothetical protein [Bradyrhizobium sp. 30]MCK1289919.1 hypothetical protein [Bradyrhizobium sp. 30]